VARASALGRRLDEVPELTAVVADVEPVVIHMLRLDLNLGELHVLRAVERTLLHEELECGVEHVVLVAAEPPGAKVVPADASTGTLEPFVDVLDGSTALVGDGLLDVGGGIRVVQVLQKPVIASFGLLGLCRVGRVPTRRRL
jgi:hypothetical protein